MMIIVIWEIRRERENGEREREKVVVVIVTGDREKEKKVEHHHLTRNVPLLSLLKIGQTTIFSHLYIYTWFK